MSSTFLQPGTSDLDDYFDLPDAGEDESEPELCVKCGVPLTSADYEGERCSQCGKEIE